VGLLGSRGVLDDLGEADDGPRQGGLRPAAELSLDAGGRRETDIGGPAEDRRDPGVGVLDVVDGVVGRLLLGQLDVEVDAGGCRP
jgi:hypothetical protein